MPSPFEQAGAYSDPTKYAAIVTGVFSSGLWTHRNPLRDPVTTYLMAKYYQANRYDFLIDGLNTEISSRLTLIRRPGNGVYNSQTFPAINAFYEFHTFSGNTESIRVMADTAATVYDATGPSTKTAIFTKSAGSGQTYFQSVGNILFFGNGVDQKKWLQPALQWAAATQFSVGQFLIDSNNNIQQVAMPGTSGGSVPTWNASVRGTTTDGTGSLVWTNRGNMVANWGMAAPPSAPTLPPTAKLSSQGPQPPGTAGTSGATGGSTSGWTNPNNAKVQDAATAQVQLTPAGNSNELQVSNFGFTIPAGATINGITVEILRAKVSDGPTGNPQGAVADQDITLLKAGTPTGNNKALSGISNAWPTSLAFQTYGGAVDLWGAAWTLADINAATFGIQISVNEVGAIGGGAGQNVSPVAGVDFVRITVNYTPAGGPVLTSNTTYWSAQTTYSAGQVILDTNGNFQETSLSAKSTGPAQPQWNDAFGSATIDGNQAWVNRGANTQAWIPSTIFLAGRIIIDANGNLQKVTTQGTSGTAAPAWNAAYAATTTDGGITWTNLGRGNITAFKGWKYATAFHYVDGGRSPLSPVTESTGAVVGGGVNGGLGDVITGTGTVEAQCDAIYLFRTLDGDETAYLFMASIPNPGANPWTFADNMADEQLNEFIQGDITGLNTPPPLGLINLAYHLSRVWGSVGNVVYYSTVQSPSVPSPAQAFPPTQVFPFPSLVKRLLPTTLGLLVFTVSDVYIIQGKGTASDPLFDAPFLKGIGLSNYNALDVNGSTIYMMTTDRATLSLDPTSGISEIGFPIGDLLETFDPASSYLTWHVSGTKDKAVFVADGSTGWFRLNPTPAPETGMTWSPKAAIAGGVKAVQSVETVPGIHKLLLGPASSGNILYRDLTLSRDNGASYTAFATLGSFILAQPGHIAEVGFITTDALATGSRPAVNVLLGEIGGAFESIPRSCSDPPQLPDSTTLYSDRHYMLETQEPVVCRHMQVQFSWPAENSANELLGYAIWGATHQEA